MWRRGMGHRQRFFLPRTAAVDAACREEMHAVKPSRIALAFLAICAVLLLSRTGLTAPPCTPMPSCSWGGPITVTIVQNLSFAPQGAGTAQTVVTAAADTRAAIFDTNGDVGALFTASVKENSITITNGGGGPDNKMSVTGWTYGGGMDNTGNGTFDAATGDANNLRIGASVTQTATTLGGAYSGTATFQITYQ